MFYKAIYIPKSSKLLAIGSLNTEMERLLYALFEILNYWKKWKVIKTKDPLLSANFLWGLQVPCSLYVANKTSNDKVRHKNYECHTNTVAKFQTS